MYVFEAVYSVVLDQNIDRFSLGLFNSTYKAKDRCMDELFHDYQVRDDLAVMSFDDSIVTFDGFDEDVEMLITLTPEHKEAQRALTSSNVVPLHKPKDIKVNSWCSVIRHKVG